MNKSTQSCASACCCEPTAKPTVEQIYTGCLAQAAYYLESKGEAAVIDPLRDPQPYLDRAEKGGAKIRYIFETHFHADFVSGHLELQRLTGATIVYGPTAKPGFAAHVAHDGETFAIGDITLKVLHTPGHTTESSCYALLDAQGQTTAVFTGDTLFLGDVGRPDLAVKSDLSQEDLAAKLYDSLHKQLLPLPDATILYPGHGAGSACGKHLAKETQDTLGHQKQVNYALQAPDRASFIKQVLTGLSAPPAYFGANARLNREGYGSLAQALQGGLTALSPDAFEAEANASSALVLDTRSVADFARAFIPQSVHVGLDGQFASWVGALIGDVNQPLLIVTDVGREAEVAGRLARIGFDKVLGYLQGGIKAWVQSGRETDALDQVLPEAWASYRQGNTHVTVLDVRTPEEFATERIEGTRNLPLNDLNDRMRDLNPAQAYVVHCAGGYRSSMAASILKARGFERITNLSGGLQALKSLDAATLTNQALAVKA
jgi:hydroxyacylglutathione hydrolase